MIDNAQAAQNQGVRSDIRVFKKGRRCCKCRMPLSIYTQGPYCRIHEDYGFKLADKIREKKRMAIMRRTEANAKRKKDLNKKEVFNERD